MKPHCSSPAPGGPIPAPPVMMSPGLHGDGTPLPPLEESWAAHATSPTRQHCGSPFALHAQIALGSPYAKDTYKYYNWNMDSSSDIKTDEDKRDLLI